MPMRSKAQNAAMHAAAEGRSTLGIPKSVGQDFVSASHGMSVSSLPQRKGQGGDPPVKHQPPSIGDAITGHAVPTKRSHRGRGVNKNSPPQTQHLAKLQSAHAKGDFSSARTHALNYAKATLGGVGQPTTSLGGAANTATVTFGSPASEADSGMADAGDLNYTSDSVRKQTLGATNKQSSTPNSRAALASIAARMRGKNG